MGVIYKNGIYFSGGGSGGTTDYTDLENKPSIGNVELTGNKTPAQLGLATVDANGKVPSSQLPSYVDDVIEGYFYNDGFYEEAAHTTAITPETGKIYVDLADNGSYRWSGSTFISISSGIDFMTSAEKSAMITYLTGVINNAPAGVTEEDFDPTTAAQADVTAMNA